MQSVIRQFVLDGEVIRCERYGSGHINETYLLVTERDHRYILQKINRRIFPDVEALMRNIASVTAFLRARDPDPRHTLTLVPARDGANYACDEAGECWRIYEFITDSLSLDLPENLEDLRQSGVAFGQFQNQLADFPAATLSETIPHFHDTPERYAQLKRAIAADPMGRLKDVRREVDLYMEREESAGELMALCRSGELPLRVTHNDTKLNNVMLDRATRTPLCVIDLDTVMPGLAANDFGDSIRFGASTALEDEPDLSKVSLSLPMYEAYTQGFAGACRGRLTPLEIETLPVGARLMTLECGTRFLADYLNGDVYFHVSRPEHNLDRARTQITLVQDMERKWDQMRLIVERC